MRTESALSFLSIGVQPPDAAGGDHRGDRPRGALHEGLGFRGSSRASRRAHRALPQRAGDGCARALEPRAGLLRGRAPVDRVSHPARLIAKVLSCSRERARDSDLLRGTPGVDPAAPFARPGCRSPGGGGRDAQAGPPKKKLFGLDGRHHRTPVAVRDHDDEDCSGADD